jgi:GAF domain-containing protein
MLAPSLAPKMEQITVTVPDSVVDLSGGGAGSSGGSMTEGMLLLRLSRELGREMDLMRMMTLVKDQARGMLNADRCAVLLRDSETGDLLGYVFDGGGGAATGEAKLDGQGGSSGGGGGGGGGDGSNDDGPNSPTREGGFAVGFRVPRGKGIAGWVAEHGEPLNIADVYNDERFDRSVDSRSGYRTTSLLCQPLFNPEGDVHGVIQVLNKQPPPNPFTRADSRLLALYSAISSVGLHNSRVWERRRTEERKVRALLEASKSLGSHLNLSVLIRAIMTTARSLLSADRCTLFLLDRERSELVTRVTDMGTDDASITAEREIRIPSTTGLAGHVCRTNTVIRLPDAYDDPRFSREMDNKSGYRTRSVLCVPLVSNDGTVLGAAQMINRKSPMTGKVVPFDDEDEELLGAFSSHAAAAIANSVLYEQTLEAQRYLDNVLNSITNVVVTTNTAGIIVSANRHPLLETLARGIIPDSSGINDTDGGGGLDATGASVATAADAGADADAGAGADAGADAGAAAGAGAGAAAGADAGASSRAREASVQIVVPTVGPDHRHAVSRPKGPLAEAIAVDRAGRPSRVGSARMRSVVGTPIAQLLGGSALLAVTRALEGNAGELYGCDDWRPQQGASASAAADHGDPDALTTLNIRTAPLLDTRQRPMGALVVIEDQTPLRSMQMTLGRYMSPQLAEVVLGHSGSLLTTLGGTVIPVTVGFADIRGFTTFAEGREPTEVVGVLNEYFGKMVPELLETGAVIDKYIGDCVMFVYGQPIPSESDAFNACRGTIGMVRAVSRLNEARSAEG